MNTFLELGRTLANDIRFEARGEWTYCRHDPRVLATFEPGTSRLGVVPGVGPTQLFVFGPQAGARPDRSLPCPGEDVVENNADLATHLTAGETPIGPVDTKAFHHSIHHCYACSRAGVENPCVYGAGAAGPAGVDPADLPAVFDAFTSPGNLAELDSNVGGGNDTVKTGLEFLYDGLSLTWGADDQYERTRTRFDDGADAIAPMDQHSLGAFHLEATFGDGVTVRGGTRYDRFHPGVDDFTRPSCNAVIPPTLAGLAPRSVLVVPGLAPPLTIGEIAFTGDDAVYDPSTFGLGGTVTLTDETTAFAGFSEGYSLPDVGAFTRRAGLSGFSALLAVSFDGVAPRSSEVG